MLRRKFAVWLGLVAILTLLFSLPLFAAEIGKDVKVTYLGQSAFKIVSPKNVVVYIDPYEQES